MRNIKKIFCIGLASLVLSLNSCTIREGAAGGGASGLMAGAAFSHHSAQGGLIGLGIGIGLGVLGSFASHKNEKYCPFCGNYYPSDIHYCQEDRTQTLYKK